MGARRKKYFAIRHPERAREPQWLRTQSTFEETVKRVKGGRDIAEAYLCGSAPYRTLCSNPPFPAWVRSQGMVTGSTGEDRVTKGPGRETPGGGTCGLRVRQTPPLVEALGTLILLLPDVRFIGSGQSG